MSLGLSQPLTETVLENLSWEVKRGLRGGLTTSPQSVNRLPRKCGILDILQPFRPQGPVTRLALLFTSRFFKEEHFLQCKSPYVSNLRVFTCAYVTVHMHVYSLRELSVKNTAPNYINIIIREELFDKVKKHYILIAVFPRNHR
jgi:hypothetical protein